jgi:methyl acetate hydrolase
LIASRTKALTGTAAMQLVEQGKLDLDRPAADWVPELGESQVLEGFSDAGQPIMRAPRRPIMLRHLVTHTAGFADEILQPGGHPLSGGQGHPRHHHVPERRARNAASVRSGRAVGVRHQHRLGRQMVEVASGKRLGACLQEHVFEPLDMTDTAFGLRPDMRTRLAKIHQRGADDALTPLDLEIPTAPRVRDGRGGLCGTVGDYLKFVRTILNRGAADGRQVLRPETVDMMPRNHIWATAGFGR